MRTYKQIIIGHHLILHGYGHWLPNDPRGSGSTEIRDDKFSELGPVHTGCKKQQPDRDELREFRRAAEPLLDFQLIWFDDAKRQALAESIEETVRSQGYTAWACAVMRNHIHLCVRRHRDDAKVIWEKVALTTAARLRLFATVPAAHSVWSQRPYKVFLYKRDDVRRVIAYIENNPVKDGLAPQSFSFITAYDGWPCNNLQKPKSR
jgi:REP element-mobilizing transposase RayT